MHIWSVGVEREALPGTSVRQHSACYFRYFSNGLDMITALRENTLGTLCILLNSGCLLLTDSGLSAFCNRRAGSINIILFSPLPSYPPLKKKKQLDKWQVQVLTPVTNLIPFTSPVNSTASCGYVFALLAALSGL